MTMETGFLNVKATGIRLSEGADGQDGTWYCRRHNTIGSESAVITSGRF